MKGKIFLLLLVTLLPAYLYAQSALTIFSEDGDKFYLVLNGQKQNPVAQTNIRIDGLSQPYYSAKILFEDNTKPEISKNIPVQDPSTNAYADVTYKIKRTKDGELKIRYFSSIPIQPDYVAPPDVYVMHFGQPVPAVGGTTVTQTTVTTTNASMPGSNVSVGINGGDMGVNMNINIQDPNMNNTVSHSTTTTTTTYSSNSSYSNAPQQQAPAGCQYPMDWSSFNAAKETVAKASFEETKLSTAKTILSSNCFNTDQVMQICKLFGFEASKLDFAKYAYSKTTDPGNYFKVGNIFDFDASKTELNDFISSGR